MNILGLWVDEKWLVKAIASDYVVFGLEAAKYPDAKSLAKGIEITITEAISKNEPSKGMSEPTDHIH
jgi:hypothetical protein